MSGAQTRLRQVHSFTDTLSSSLLTKSERHLKSYSCAKDGGRLLYQVTGPIECTHPKYAGHLFTVKGIYFPEAVNSVTSGTTKPPTLKIEVVIVSELPPKFRGTPKIPTSPHRFVWRVCGSPDQQQPSLVEIDSDQNDSNQEEKGS